MRGKKCEHVMLILCGTIVLVEWQDVDEVMHDPTLFFLRWFCGADVYVAVDLA